MITSNPVLEVIAAVHADLTIDGRVVHLAGVSALGNPWIDMDYSKISINPKPIIVLSLAEVLQKQTFTFVAANDTDYRFVINQTQPDGSVLPFTIAVHSAVTGATAATIATQINAAIASKAGAGLKVTSSGASTVITIVALTGYPLFTLSNLVAGVAAGAAALTIAYTASTDATPAVFSSVAHGLVTGQSIVLGGAPTAGSPAAIATTAGGSRRVTYVSANTFSVEGTVATGTPDIAGGTVLLQPQAARGTYADLVADGIIGGSITGRYAQVLFKFGQQETEHFDMSRDRGTAQRLWINENATNYAAFAAYLQEVLNGFGAGVTTFDPQMAGLN